MNDLLAEHVFIIVCESSQSDDVLSYALTWFCDFIRRKQSYVKEKHTLIYLFAQSKSKKLKQIRS